MLALLSHENRLSKFAQSKSTKVLIMITNEVLDYTKVEAGKCKGHAEVVFPVTQKKGVAMTSCYECEASIPLELDNVLTPAGHVHRRENAILSQSLQKRRVKMYIHCCYLLSREHTSMSRMSNFANE